jgi:cell division septal protein FtsQ
MVARRRAAAAPLSRRSSRSRTRAARRRPAIEIGDLVRVLAGAVALACAITLAWISVAGTPAIASVDVVGARHVRAGQAIAQSGLLDTPTFGASAAAARARLRTLPAVADARVDLMLPSSARITLIEREATGRWVASDGLEWFVDVDGVLFPSNDPSAAPQLRVFDERARKSAGERLDPALVRVALRLAAISSGELRADATVPRVAVTGSSILVLRFGSGWEIRFGGPEAFDEKLAAAKRYLRDNPQRRLDYVDVRNPNLIVFSPQ